jgi:anti-anti-sigma regulatory factor
MTSLIPISQRSKVALPPVLDIGATADLKRVLLEAAAAGGGVDVDASAVQRVTSPCLQILVAAAQDVAPEEGRRFRLHSVPQVLSEAIERLALAQALGMQEA